MAARVAALRAKVAALRAKVAALIPPRTTVTPAPVSTTCVRCGGAGWVRVSEIGSDGQWQARLQPCDGQAHEQERYERARRMSDMSDALLALTFDGYDAQTSGNTVALAAAQAWATTDTGRAARPWLLLWGGMGTGKTHLLAAAFNALVAQGRYPLYTLVPTLLDHIRDGLESGQSQEYSSRFRAVQQSPLLILDDLAAERRTGWTDETLFKLLDYRYRHELPTAVASNSDPDELEERISSRLQDHALSTVVLMCGADYRKSTRERGR